MIGETGEYNDGWNAKWRALHERFGIGWVFWPYKNLEFEPRRDDHSKAGRLGSDRGGRQSGHPVLPPREQAQAVLNSYLEAAKFRNVKSTPVISTRLALTCHSRTCGLRMRLAERACLAARRQSHSSEQHQLEEALRCRLQHLGRSRSRHHHSSSRRTAGRRSSSDGIFPALTKELLDENGVAPADIHRSANNGLVLCIQSFVIKTPHHNILIDSCVGNHKPRPTRPFWNMMNSDRFEKLAAAGLTVNDIDYVMCTHLHGDHVGWKPGSTTAAGCRPSPRRNTSWPTASSPIGRSARRTIRRARHG